MHNVAVLFTQHESNGMCNSDELFKILWSLQPDIIFEEIGHEVYDQIYIQQNRTTLESTAIKLYLLTNDVEHLPVDTFDRPDSYRSGRNHLADVLQKYFHQNERLNRAFNQLVQQVHRGGFPFLNSDQNDTLLDEIESEENHILTEIADDNLNQIAQLRNEVNSKRDEVIIDNIYKYGEEKTFQRGILLIGAGHRRSIKRKLDKIEPRYGVEIKWHFLAE
jgi:hypothetical protein